MGYPHPSHPRESPILSKYFGDPEARTLAGWRARGGYEALEQALNTDPQELQTVVKDSGLRGRGGAGFPTGMKWSFMKPDGKTHYLCCNADESEPGTFKDREIMRWTPHGLVEGVALAAHAIYAQTAYIYIRGEMPQGARILEKAAQELALITGQKPAVTRAKKSISNFKLRKGMPIGLRVTLRRDRMWIFLEKLLNVALPRIRDFRGLNPNSFDGRGNYNLGLREQLIFPEITYDMVDALRGMDIAVVTTAETDEEARALLELLGFPFRK